MSKQHCVKTLRVSARTMFGFVKHGTNTIIEVSGNRLPEDAEIVNATYDMMTGDFVLLIQSDEYPEAPEGHRILEADRPQYRCVDPTAWIEDRLRERRAIDRRLEESGTITLAEWRDEVKSLAI